MSVIRISYIVLFLAVCLISSAQADSSVWQVVKGDNLLFIGGTIHVLSKSDYPLPPAFESAYSHSSTLVFETDLQKSYNPEFEKLMMSYLLLPEGQTLKQVLKQDTFQTLEQYMSNRGIPITGFMNFKPSMLAITLVVIELKRLGIDGTGVDEFFSLRASNDQKKVGQLETVEQQLEFLSTMGEGHEDELITYTLHDIQELSTRMASLTEAWRQGDIKKFEEVVLVPFKRDFPEVFDKLIVQRNDAWVPKIESMLNTKDVEFVLVGTLHLIGEDGVLDKLAKKGYKIRML